MTLFVLPSLKATTSDKLCFFKMHPIQPSGDLHRLPFQACRIYYRIMTNQTRVHRKWLSYSLHLNKIYCVICLCYTDRTSPFTKGLTPSTKHIYNQVELHEKSDIHGTALMAYLLQSKNQCTESKLKKHHSAEVAQKRLVLQRVIDIIIFIGTWSLAFRGKHEAAYSLNDNKNMVIFLHLFYFLPNMILYLSNMLMNQ